MKPVEDSGQTQRNGKIDWAHATLLYPIDKKDMKTLPAPNPGVIPQIQHKLFQETPERKVIRLQRLEAVKSNFTHAWNGYKQHAWLNDEVRPISGTGLNTFGGWAATLVDSLDTLWMMDMTSEFEDAVKAVEKIDFTQSTLDEINVFETTIRYLGGLLAAYDLSEYRYPALLRKASELGNMLYHAFDTPNHMPITRWKFQDTRTGMADQIAPKNILVAEIGSLTLEFTRLSQLTRDNKYFDAVQRITDVFEAQQDKTHLPGMWPVTVNAMDQDFSSDTLFTLGGMSDSAYEYLPKMHLLLGGASSQYRSLYFKALATMKRYIFYRPMTHHPFEILIPGSVRADGHQALEEIKTEPEAQHLGCFVGGMVGLGARAFGQEKDVAIARALVEGCLWAYESNPSGIMPEIMHTSICPKREGEKQNGREGEHEYRTGRCEFDEKAWSEAIEARNPDSKVPPTERAAAEHLVPGVTSWDDRRYILRPEAIESIFLLYRFTADTTLQDRAWNMFTSVVGHSQTDIAHAALSNVLDPKPSSTQVDRMESFWLAETLKYFYLLYSDESLVSLDEWVFNTEAHPLRWRKP